MESRAIASTPLVSALLDKVWQRVDPCRCLLRKPTGEKVER